MDREVDLSGEQGLAQRRHEDPRAADLRDGGTRGVACGDDAHQLDVTTEPLPDGRRGGPGLGERQGTAPSSKAEGPSKAEGRSEAQGGRHSPPPGAGSTSTTVATGLAVTAAGAARSSPNSSRRASA